MKKVYVFFFALFLLACNNADLDDSQNAIDENVQFEMGAEDHDNSFEFNKIEPGAFAPAGNSERTPKGKENQGAMPSNQEATEDVPLKKSLKIIREGTMTVRSENIDSSKFQIDILLHHLDGYYETESLEHYDQRSVYQLVIRVPSSEYDKLLSGLEKGGDKIEAKNIKAKDVTEEYNDVQTQLQNKKAYLTRYLQLLNQAKNVEEILMIEDHIRPLQNDIERHIGRLRYLDDRVGYSTLSVQLYQEFKNVPPVVAEDGFWFRLGQSFKSGWTHVVNFIINMIAVWPQLIIITVLFFVIRGRRKRIVAWLKK